LVGDCRTSAAGDDVEIKIGQLSDLLRRSSFFRELQIIVIENIKRDVLVPISLSLSFSLSANQFHPFVASFDVEIASGRKPTRSFAASNAAFAIR